MKSLFTSSTTSLNRSFFIIDSRIGKTIIRLSPSGDIISMCFSAKSRRVLRIDPIVLNNKSNLSILYSKHIGRKKVQNTE